MVTLKELQERIKNKTLKTRNGMIVRKLEVCQDMEGNLLYEVYVESIPWCLVTIDARTGRADKNEEWDEDLMY